MTSPFNKPVLVGVGATLVAAALWTLLRSRRGSGKSDSTSASGTSSPCTHNKTKVTVSLMLHEDQIEFLEGLTKVWCPLSCAYLLVCFVIQHDSCGTPRSGTRPSRMFHMPFESCCVTRHLTKLTWCACVICILLFRFFPRVWVARGWFGWLQEEIYTQVRCTHCGKEKKTRQGKREVSGTQTVEFWKVIIVPRACVDDSAVSRLISTLDGNFDTIFACFPDFVAVTVELYQSQVDFLSARKEKHGLPDTGKALRVLLDYARTEGNVTDIFFTPATGCNCGAKH